MPNDVDDAMEKAEEELRRILTSIRLTSTEKEFVNAAARRVLDAVYQSLESIPEDKRWEMRGIVLAVAIALVIGPGKGAALGVDMFNTP